MRLTLLDRTAYGVVVPAVVAATACSGSKEAAPIPATASAYDALPERIRLLMDKPFMGDLDALVARRMIRVAVTFSRTHYFIGQANGGFEVLPALYGEVGVRRIALKMTATILQFPEVTWKPGIWEPVFGVTYRPMLGRKLRLMTHADLGGIGDGDHRTSTATALLEWKPISHLSFGGGWGVMYLRADGTILTKPVHFKQTLNGPMLTLGIPF